MSNQITQARDSFIENLHSMATGSYLREEDKEFWEAPYPESVVDEARVIIDSLISSAAKVPAANAANTPSVNASADEAEGEDDAPSPQTVAVISAITKEVNALLSLSAAHEDAVLEDEEISDLNEILRAVSEKAGAEPRVVVNHVSEMIENYSE